MRIPPYTIAILLAASISSCEKELDFDYNDIDPIVVIEGSLTDQQATVSVTSTTPMDEAFDDTRLTDASVTLTDLTTGSTTLLPVGNDGLYTAPVNGIAGHTYSLSVQRGADLYTSTSTMLPATDLLHLDFQWLKMPYDYVAILQVSFSDIQPDYGDCYWIRVYRNGEAYMWDLTTDLYASGNIIDIVMMTSRKDIDEEDENKLLEKGDNVTVSVTPIDRAMFDYLVALQVGNSNGPRMFDGEFCLGYFLASPVTSGSIIFDPDSMPEIK